MWNATLVIARARLQIARNTFWRGTLLRKLGLLIIALMIVITSLVIYWTTSAFVRWITSPAFVAMLERATREAPDAGIPTDFQPYLEALPSLALFGAFILLIFMSFTSSLSSLYLAGDLEMLLATPAPMRSVFVVKLLGGLSIPYLVLFLLLGPFLLGYGQGMAFGPAFFVVAPLLLGLFPLLPAGIGALVVMALVRVLPAHRAREIVGVIGGLLAGSWYIVNQFATDVSPRLATVHTLNSLRQLDLPLLPSAWAGRALLAAGQGEWLTLLVYGGLFAAISIGAFAGCLVLVEQLYYGGWANMAAQGGKVKAKNRAPGVEQEQRATAIGAWFSRLSSLMPAQSRAIMFKDLRLFLRDLRNLQQVIFPLALTGIWTFRLLTEDASTPLDGDRGMRSISVFFSVGLAFFVCYSLSSALSGPSISREGKGFWLLKTAPISARRILLGKLALAYLPFPTIGALFIVFLSIVQHSTLSDLTRSFALLLLGGLGTTSIAIGLSATFPKLNWENPKQQTTFRAGCLTFVFTLLYFGLGLALTVGLPALAAYFPHLEAVLLLTGWALFVALTIVTLWASFAIGTSRLDRLDVA